MSDQDKAWARRMTRTLDEHAGKPSLLTMAARICDEARAEIEALTAENSLLQEELHLTRDERDQAIYERDEARVVGHA